MSTLALTFSCKTKTSYIDVLTALTKLFLNVTKVNDLLTSTLYLYSFFSSPEPKARVSYCHSAPSVVRPSVVRPSVRKLVTFSTSSPEPLEGFWWNLVGMKYSWSLTSVVVFGQIRPGADPGRGQNRSRGSPSSRNSSSDRKATATNRMDSNDLEACGKKCCYFWFHSEVKFLTRFWRLFGLRHFALF